jgi:hypothetical protein
VSGRYTRQHFKPDRLGLLTILSTLFVGLLFIEIPYLWDGLLMNNLTIALVSNKGINNVIRAESRNRVFAAIEDCFLGSGHIGDSSRNSAGHSVLGQA